MKWDGHTHSPYCPHGDTAPLERYVQQAIQLGFEQLSITEHAPLPSRFKDPVPAADSAMRLEDLEPYLQLCATLKRKYHDQIRILIGLEIDYLSGFEKETTQFLNEYGPLLDDAILSLHFIPLDHGWVCIDYSADVFQKQVLAYFPSVDDVYHAYYRHLAQMVAADLGPYKPKRIGHFTLIEKYKRRFPPESKRWMPDARNVLDLIQQKGYSLDFNTAGLRKEDCGDVYPSGELFLEARSRKIPFVYGSDAHHPDQIGFGYEQFITSLAVDNSNHV